MINQNPIRRGQLIAPFGVGALVDFRDDESLMAAGIDEWPFANERCPADWLVLEERLQERLGVTEFRLPPDFREPSEGGEHSYTHVPFVRFPLWHYCPIRGVMAKLNTFGNRRRCPCNPKLDCHSAFRSNRPWLIPSRFIAVCPKGHIEDFPFMEWVHRGSEWGESCQLRLMAGRSSANLSGQKVRCSCGKEENMSGSFDFHPTDGGALHNRINYDCSMGRPWLGEEGSPNRCGQYLRVVQRGASNVYFPHTVSSIHLPLWNDKVDKQIASILEDEKAWTNLTRSLDDGKYIKSIVCETIANIYEVDPVDLQEAAQRKIDGVHETVAGGFRTETEFRRQEFDAMREGVDSDSSDLRISAKAISDYGAAMSMFLNGICLVRKLRETRALVGFSRLIPFGDSSETDDNLQQITEQENPSWLPATVVYGEGIFLDFSEARVNEWAAEPRVKQRLSRLGENYNNVRRARGLMEVDVRAENLLLHTFAHILISQLSFDSGYGSASLRERIYCDATDSDHPMYGILIYTASGDSEGTMGGVVRQGQPDRFPQVFGRALNRISWCSSDPVCIESSGQGNQNANLAACHGCVLLPETSCEMGNQFLDRGLLIGTSDEPELGFFSEIRKFII